MFPQNFKFSETYTHGSMTHSNKGNVFVYSIMNPTPCLIASGAVHLIGNFPPSKLKLASLASPKSDTCHKNRTLNRIKQNIETKYQKLIPKLGGRYCRICSIFWW